MVGLHSGPIEQHAYSPTALNDVSLGIVVEDFAGPKSGSELVGLRAIGVIDDDDGVGVRGVAEEGGGINT